MTYREAALRLADYAAEMGFTHIELLPVFEHPAAGVLGLPGRQPVCPLGPVRHAS